MGHGNVEGQYFQGTAQEMYGGSETVADTLEGVVVR